LKEIGIGRIRCSREVRTHFVLGYGILFQPWQSLPLGGDERISLIRPQSKVGSSRAQQYDSQVLILSYTPKRDCFLSGIITFRNVW
jgi:hypothetical protein